MPKLVSIVMACYNSEKYIARAILSVKAQTHRDWELICIDDGSIDETATLIESFALTDSRIRLLTQANAGPASARRQGFKVGRGEYFTVLDSDDWLDASSIEIALSNAVKFTADSVVYRALVYDHTSDDYTSFHALRGTMEGKVLTGKEAFEMTLPWRIHGMALWHQNIIKSEACDTSDPLNNFNADEYITRRLFLRSNVVYIGSAKYYIGENPDSLTRRFSSRHLMAVITDRAVTDLAIRAGAKLEVVNYALETQYCSILRTSSMLARWGADGDEVRIIIEIYKAVMHYRKMAQGLPVRRGDIRLVLSIIGLSSRSFLARWQVFHSLYRGAKRCLR